VAFFLATWQARPVLLRSGSELPIERSIEFRRVTLRAKEGEPVSCYLQGRVVFFLIGMRGSGFFTYF